MLLCYTKVKAISIIVVYVSQRQTHIFFFSFAYKNQKSAIFVGHLIWKERFIKRFSLYHRFGWKFTLLYTQPDVLRYTCMCNLCLILYTKPSKDKKRNITYSWECPTNDQTKWRGIEKEYAHRANRDAEAKKVATTTTTEVNERTRRKKRIFISVYKKWIETREKNRYETRPRIPFMPYVNNVCSSSTSISFCIRINDSRFFKIFFSF